MDNIKTRNEEIHEKGFNMIGQERAYSVLGPEEYKKIKVGVRHLEDAILNLGSIKQTLPTHMYTNKKNIIKALVENDLTELRAISNFYYNLNGAALHTF